MNSSASITKLALALVAAQPEIEGAKKDRANPFFKSMYADLGSVMKALEVIAAHDLSYIQVSHDRENAAAIETIILHNSGEWLSCGIVSVPVSKHDAQGFGSALTYARRYSLSAAFGVSAEDDDGNAAAAAKPEKVGKGAMKPNTPTTGAWEAVSIDVQNQMMDTAHRIKTLLKKNDDKGAAAELEEAAKDFEGREDYMMAQWTRFESSERRALKEAGFHFSTTTNRGVDAAERQAA